MDTLRSFVDAVLDQGTSTSQADAKYYSKPDLLADNFELRRLVSAGGREDRTDFFEFYWAHLIPMAAWNRLASWYWVLMRRHPKEVPVQVMPLYVLSWLFLAVVVSLGLDEVAQVILAAQSEPSAVGKLPWLIIMIVGVLSATVRSYVGDAAVYLSPTPSNIEARQKIRVAGLGLLDKVVQSGRYDRIIIVGHSLGSVIGYDVLALAWQRHCDEVRHRISAEWRGGKLPKRSISAIRDAELIAKEIRGAANPTRAQMEAFAAKWRIASRSVNEEQRINGDGWLVTDFVTLGSPLAHGALLLAKDRPDFERRARERELPHCPPVRELNGKFSFEHRDLDDQAQQQRAVILNHAAIFAVVNWTNLYFPCRYGLKGDLVGGPVAPLFWAGVRDIPVATKTWGGWLAHTHYWRRNPADEDISTAPVPKVREALDLKRQRPWPTSSSASAVAHGSESSATKTDTQGSEVIRIG